LRDLLLQGADEALPNLKEVVAISRGDEKAFTTETQRAQRKHGEGLASDRIRVHSFGELMSKTERPEAPASFSDREENEPAFILYTSAAPVNRKAPFIASRTSSTP